MAARPSQHPLAVALRYTPQRLAAAKAALEYTKRHGEQARRHVQAAQFYELGGIYAQYDAGIWSLEEAVDLATAAFDRFTAWFNSH